MIGAFIMLAFGYNPIAAYRSLFVGSVGSVYSWAELFSNATPLILTALTFAIAMRGGLFNIGAEGQLYMNKIWQISFSLASTVARSALRIDRRLPKTGPVCVRIFRLGFGRRWLNLKHRLVMEQPKCLAAGVPIRLERFG